MKRDRGSVPVVSSDVLVIGGGGAGCQAAIWAHKGGADHVCLVEKGIIGSSGCTVMGTFSCCAALGYEEPRDNPEVHYQDTFVGGAGLADPALLRRFVEDAPSRVLELAGYGVPFEKKDGRLKQAPMPGHTYPRACYVGLRTGQAMQWGLRKVVKGVPGIRRVNDVLIYRLLHAGGRVFGAMGLCRKTLTPIQFLAKATIIATGGCGQLYFHTTTSQDNTGDGLSIALEAGASFMDMEFFQFYPTSSIYPRLPGVSRTAPTFLRFVPGCRLFNVHEEEFIGDQYPDWQTTMTRDRLSQLIYREIMEGRGTERGGVYMDVTSAPREEIKKALHMGNYFDRFERAGVDLKKTRLEIGVASHYLMGGIRVDEDGGTDLVGLFAGGEAVAGIHAANRLGGNALSEILVTGAIAGQGAARFASQQRGEPPPVPVRSEWEEWIEGLIGAPRSGLLPGRLKRSLQDVMWQHAGVQRSGQGLKEGLDKLSDLQSALRQDMALSHGAAPFHMELADAMETRLMLDVSRVILSAAREREESRGAHFRFDFPEERQEWKKNLIVRKAGDELAFEQKGQP